MLSRLVIAAIIGMLSIEARATTAEVPSSDTQLTTIQKTAVLAKLEHRASECLAEVISHDTRYTPDANLGNLIVADIASCKSEARALIDTYDRLFGEGLGEVFFMGPYLDVLPQAVLQKLHNLQ